MRRRHCGSGFAVLHALALFEGSRLLADYWGGRAAEMYATLKRVEAERYNAIVTPLDYDWVLRSA